MVLWRDIRVVARRKDETSAGNYGGRRVDAPENRDSKNLTAPRSLLEQGP